MNKKSAISLILAVTFVLYPPLVYFGLQRIGPRLLAGCLLCLLVVRMLVGNSQNRQMLAMYIAAGLALAGALIADSSLSLKLYPVLVSTALLVVFGLSLLYPPTVIERLARLQDPHLSAGGVSYTRKVTVVWCVFFALNGTIALATVFAGDAVWALYNGLISYLCIGGLLGGEWLYRKWILKYHGVQ